MTTTAGSAYSYQTGVTKHGFPIDELGQPVEPDPYFDEWDQTPHAHFVVGVAHIRLGDVILGTHQIDGIGRANQRGTDAFRLDLEYVVSRSLETSARLVLPIDHQLRIKRYSPETPHRWAWVKMYPAIVVNADGKSETMTTPAALQPDYGSNSDRCGCGTSKGNPPVEVNEDGYEGSTTICDACVDSWEQDHEVVRH